MERLENAAGWAVVVVEDAFSASASKAQTQIRRGCLGRPASVEPSPNHVPPGQFEARQAPPAANSTLPCPPKPPAAPFRRVCGCLRRQSHIKDRAPPFPATRASLPFEQSFTLHSVLATRHAVSAESRR